MVIFWYSTKRAQVYMVWYKALFSLYFLGTWSVWLVVHTSWINRLLLTKSYQSESHTWFNLRPSQSSQRNSSWNFLETVGKCSISSNSVQRNSILWASNSKSHQNTDSNDGLRFVQDTRCPCLLWWSSLTLECRHGGSYFCIRPTTETQKETSNVSSLAHM